MNTMTDLSRAVDLHVHSTASDGTYTPAELVQLAVSAGLSAFALTDHDTIAGISEAKLAAADCNCEVISGVELSCDYNGREVHMVGLFIDETDPALQAELASFNERRIERNKEMVRRLQAEGLAITYEGLLADNHDRVITRGNIAKYLVDHQLVRDNPTVFSRYLGDDCRCFVPREKISPGQAIRIIHAAGGLSILAHPLLYHMNLEQLRDFLALLKADGLDGMEAIYSTFQPGDERNMKRIAGELDLLISGGSDFHGSNKPHIRLGTGMGRLFVPYEALEMLKQHL